LDSLRITAAEVATAIARDGACWCTERALQNWVTQRSLLCLDKLYAGLAAGTVETDVVVAVRRESDHRWIVVDADRCFPNRYR